MILRVMECLVFSHLTDTRRLVSTTQRSELRSSLRQVQAVYQQVSEESDRAEQEFVALSSH
jgi:hypothetical protein